DRDIRPGAMFADADLFGVPVRVIVSPKTLAAGCVEIAARDKSFRENVPVADATSWLRDRVNAMLAAFR
ncbi:MAG: His/Gly/Thr/Pro-type tRNA ligase C-terminal domain-containing protein, partial [Oscillospiraceae bacterium]